MTSRILVAMDDSEMAAEALRYALEMHGDAELTVLAVVGEPSQLMWKATSIAMADDPRTKAEEIAAPVLDRAREIAAEHEREIATTVGYGAPAREIVNRAEEFDAVVIGSHGGTLRDRLIVGDVAKTVVNRSPVPVTVVR